MSMNDMIELKLYGKPSHSYEFIKHAVLKKVKSAGIDVHLEEIDDVKIFIEKQLKSIPAFEIDEEVIDKIGLKDINDFTTKVSQWILKKENFGEMKKIIVPVDFSDAAENAVIFAKRFNDSINGVVKLIHIYRRQVVNDQGLLYLDPDLEKRIKNQLNEYVNVLNDSLDNDQSTKCLFDQELIIGLASDEIIEISKEENQILIIGSTGASSNFKKLFGSVSTEVALRGKCPVIIVPPKAQFDGLKNIMHCTSDPELDASTFDQILPLLKTFDADLHLFHSGFDDNYNGEELLKMWENFYPKEKIKIYVEKNENLVEAIDQYVLKNEISMISISNAKRGFWGNVFRKNHTKQMAISSELPLLILNKK